MGFSVMFMRLECDTLIDPDREGIATFLRERGLEVAPSADGTHHLTGPDGFLEFDGRWTDLHLSPLDTEDRITGGIWHATLSDEECRFVHDLCVAGKMLVVNPRGGRPTSSRAGTTGPNRSPTTARETSPGSMGPTNSGWHSAGSSHHSCASEIRWCRVSTRVPSVARTRSRRACERIRGGMRRSPQGGPTSRMPTRASVTAPGTGSPSAELSVRSPAPRATGIRDAGRRPVRCRARP